MLKKVIAGCSGKITCVKRLLTIIVLFFLSFPASWAQEAQPREFVHAKNGLRYQVVKGDTSLVIDKMAVFPGGEAAMLKYLQSKISYPEASRKNGKEGLVKAKFVINKTGEIGQIKISEGLDQHTDSLVLKIIGEMPVWQPAMQGQIPISVLYQLPVRFTLLSEAERKNVREYKADGISFRHFKTWQISRYEKNGDVELKLERKGFGKTGLIFVNIESDTIDTRLHMDRKLAHLTRNNDTSRLPLKFNSTEKSTFNNYPAWRASGSMQMNAVGNYLVGKYIIEVFTFKAGNKNIAVTYLQFEEDRKKTNLDFGVFQGGFKAL